MKKPGFRQRLTDQEMQVLSRKDATDEEIEATVRSPRYWTYIVRHPSGLVAAWGRGRSRQACERNAVKGAETAAIEFCAAEDTWSLGRWRFVLWPPH
jgi:hypothetical protein